MKKSTVERSPLYPKILFGFTNHPITVWAEVSERLVRFSLARMRPIMLGHTLDLDSTVFCRYGEQQGSLRGYNPQKPGRPSHHPLAGFFEKRFLEYLEQEGLPYIIVARLTAVVRKLVIHRIPSTAWHVVAGGIEVADVEVSLPNWRAGKRRFVCLRQEILERPEARGRRLVDCPGYTYRVVVTCVPYAAEVVTRMYAGRADSENRIKELKEDLSLDTFCLKSFDATDAAFRMGCVLYNLLADFRETLLPRAWFERRLRAVRDLSLLSVPT